MHRFEEAEFDVREIPFSTRGSWLDISPVVGLHEYADDLHLVSHTTRMTPVLRLVPFHQEAAAKSVVRTTSSVLTWVTDHGDVQAVFDSPERIRLRGQAVGLRLEAASGRLTPFTGAYFFQDPVTTAPTFSSYETGRRYRVSVIAGTVSTEGAGALGQAERSVQIEADQYGTWEIAVEEIATAKAPFRPEQTFDQAVEASSAEFVGFLDRVAGWRSTETPAATLAAYVLWSAIVSPSGFVTRESVLMSKHWMDKIWSWDHCFNALALAEGEPDLALDQFLAPFDHQTPEGALPDSITQSEVLYNFVKPPIHGWALTRLRPLIGELEPHRLREIHQRLTTWTRFWLEHRRVPGHALAHYQHGNDSGWDNSTLFDSDRVVEAPDLAAFLVIQMRALSELAAKLGDEQVADDWRRQAVEMTAALMTLWSGDAFGGRSTATDEPSGHDSLLSLMPLVVGADLPADVRDILVARLSRHLTDWGAATEPPSSPDYEADGYWRGPIWAPSTVLIESGLRSSGAVAKADEISAKFRNLCENNGFAENFDALTGQGLRDRAYTWTASAYLYLAAAWTRRDS